MKKDIVKSKIIKSEKNYTIKVLLVIQNYYFFLNFGMINILLNSQMYVYILYVNC